MKIPDHVLKKYAQHVAGHVLKNLAYYNIPNSVRDALWEAVGPGEPLADAYKRLYELLETAHVGLSWTKESK